MTSLERQYVDLICPAIQRRQRIIFYYRDTTKNKEGWRIVDPYLIGVSKTTGNVQVVGWFQPNDLQREDGELEGWRLYNLSGISEFNLIDHIVSGTRPHYNPQDKRMRQVLCRV